MHARPRLFDFELAWSTATFETFHPEGTVLVHGIRKMQPARFFDDTLAAVPFEQSMGLRLALWLVALAPLFLLGKVATITSLGPSDRVRLLERLLASPVYAVRQLVLAMKAMGIMLYAQSADIRTQMYASKIVRPKVVHLRLAPAAAVPHEHAAE